MTKPERDISLKLCARPGKKHKHKTRKGNFPDIMRAPGKKAQAHNPKSACV